MLTLLLIAAAGFAAGLVNAIAGGGTLLSFPALVAAGHNAIVASATNTVALWPGSLAGTLAFRRELTTVRRWLLLLIIPSFAGGVAGAILLLRTPASTFERLVPFLILGATLLVASQEVITARFRFFADRHANPTAAALTAALLFQFVVGVYGGYFGAGIGILMLAALGLLGLRDMHQMNGLKNLLAISINGIAAIWFAFSGVVIWRDAAVMAITSIAGAYAGARLARRLGHRFVRVTVVAIGLALTIALFVRT